MADGDGRAVINLADEVFAAVAAGQPPLTREALTKLVQRRAPLYDKGRDGHYNLISALHKSVRGSDPDAALYWLARMLDGGEDRLFIARRLVRMAVEDIGLADPQALAQALAAKDVYDFLGSPRASWRWRRRRSTSPPRRNRTPPTSPTRPPCVRPRSTAASPRRNVILNAPTKLMEDEGYGDGYEYDHDAPDALLRPGLFPRSDGPPAVLRAARARLRTRDRQAARVLGRAQEEAARGLKARRANAPYDCSRAGARAGPYALTQARNISDAAFPGGAAQPRRPGIFPKSCV